MRVPALFLTCLSLVICLVFTGCSRTEHDTNNGSVISLVETGRGHFGKVQHAFVTMPISSDSIWLSVAHLERSHVLMELGLGLHDAWGAICEVVVQLMPSTPKPAGLRTVARKHTDI